jgi:hypothetical protein
VLLERAHVREVTEDVLRRTLDVLFERAVLPVDLLVRIDRVREVQGERVHVVLGEVLDAPYAGNEIDVV